MRLFWLCVVSWLVNIPFLSSFEYRDDDFEEENYNDDEERKNFDYVLADAFMDDMYDIIKKQEEQDEANNPVPSSSCQPQFKFAHAEVEIIFNKLELGLRFFEDYVDQLIVDGLFGVRFCQGILENILLTLPSTNVYHAKISRLAKLAKELSDKSFKTITAKATTYTNQFIKILQKPQVFYLPWKHLHELESYIYEGELDKKPIIESESDHCMTLLLGTVDPKKSPQEQKSCVVTDDCLHWAMRRHTTGYTLTHQLLYFLLGLNNGCEKQLSKRLGGQENLHKLLRKQSSNIVFQMLNEPFNGYNIDLNLERGVISSTLGIMESTRNGVVRSILKFVNKRGCVVNADLINSARRKRDDKLIGGCSQHSNGLMVGYLAATIRFIIQHPNCVQ